MNHNEAKRIVEAALPELTPAESLFLRANAQFESNYARGWREGMGAGSHNWGAVTMGKPEGETDCGPNGFAHRDSRYSPTLGKIVEYVTCFRAYPDDEAGIKHMASILFKQNVLDALAAGDLYGASAAMRANKYYIGREPTIAQQVANRHKNISSITDAIVNATGEPYPFVPGEEPEGPSSSEPPPSPPTSSRGPYRNLDPAELVDLRWGSEGPLVGLLQRMLRKQRPHTEKNYYEGNLDDDFGPMTDQAVRDYQIDQRLKVDGWVGPKTWKKLP